MKRMLIVGVLILKGLVFANSEEQIYGDIKDHLKLEQKIAFEEIFNTNEKLLDSYKIDLYFLKTSDVNYDKKLKFLELKIRDLEKIRDSELEKLKNDLINNPSRYKETVEKI